jgi:hypothetical protein
LEEFPDGMGQAGVNLTYRTCPGGAGVVKH